MPRTKNKKSVAKSLAARLKKGKVNLFVGGKTSSRRSVAKKQSLYQNVGLPGMQDGKVIKLRYCDFMSLTSLAGAQIFNSYMLNNIYDPDYVNFGTNHQPFGRDEYAVFYNKYLVVNAKIKVDFTWNTYPSNYKSVQCFVMVDNDTTLPTTLQTKQERYPGCVKQLVGSGVGDGKVTLTAEFDASKWFKIPKKSLPADHQVEALISGGPAKPVYCHVGIQTADSTTVSGIVDCNSEIEFTVKFLDPKPILGS